MTGGAREISAPGMALRTAAILFVFVIIFTGLLSGAYLWTKPAIEASQQEHVVTSRCHHDLDAAEHHDLKPPVGHFNARDTLG